MTQQEFDYWLGETKKSEGRWMFDRITYANRGDMLFYKGGIDGVYAEVTNQGELTIGDYEGALPHIGEAIFTPKVEKKYPSKDEAFKTIAEAVGQELLLAMLMQ